MDIQKAASSSAYAFAEIKRQRELAAVQVADVAASGARAEVRRSGNRTDEHVTAVTPNELQAVLDHLNQPTKLRKETEEPYQTILSARTKHALNAYQAQVDLPQHEAKSALSQMLGVDDYA